MFRKILCGAGALGTSLFASAGTLIISTRTDATSIQAVSPLSTMVA